MVLARIYGAIPQGIGFLEALAIATDLNNMVQGDQRLWLELGAALFNLKGQRRAGK